MICANKPWRKLGKVNKKISVIIPAKNEAQNLRNLLPELMKLKSDIDMEIIVVNDGSDDDTSIVCEQSAVIELKHEYSLGNGGAVKSGARIASGEIFIFMDGDGQHNPQDIPRLLSRFGEGYDLVVGSRGSKSQASFGRLAANRFYNNLATWMVGVKVRDLTSGFRVVNAQKFREFLYLLPNGFSYPTTSTMAFFRAGYLVCYEPIVANKRLGKSHINIVLDGLRFLLIIFKIGTLYSPLKIFTPISVFLFLVGITYYGYTYFSFSRFTNMSALLFSTSLMIFLMGLISEQVTSLIYRK